MKRWLSSLPPGKPLAVITASSVNALSFARSLGRRGVPVLILDSDGHLAVHTRFARVVTLEPSQQNPKAWIDKLVEVGECLQAPAVLFPTADQHTVLLADHEERLRPYYRFLVLPGDTALRCISKRFQIEHAIGLGVAVPDTRFPGSQEEIEQLASEFGYPCILKPDRSHSGAKVLAGNKLVVAESAQALLQAYSSLAAADVPCMVQEIVPGPDTELVSYLGFWGADGNELAFITKRKLRQFPQRYGNGSIQRTEDLPEVAELSRRLLRGLDYRGFAGVEFKFDRRDGSYRFVEINPRSSAMNELAVFAGVDLPWIAYRALTGEHTVPEEGPAFRTGMTCVNEEWDLQAFRELRSRGEITFMQWLRSLRGAHRIITAVDDPKPIMAGLARAVFPPLRKGHRR